MIHIEGSPKFDRFWLDGAVSFGLDTNCDLRIGRRGISLLTGCTEKRLDFVVVAPQSDSYPSSARTAAGSLPAILHPAILHPAPT